jgi:ParB family chromosome partitioning protein
VRAVEEIVAMGAAAPAAPVRKRRAASARTTSGLESFAEGLASRLDTRVVVTMGQRNRGRVTIEFAGVSDLERIVELLGGPQGSGGAQAPHPSPATDRKPD